MKKMGDCTRVLLLESKSVFCRDQHIAYKTIDLDPNLYCRNPSIFPFYDNSVTSRDVGNLR